MRRTGVTVADIQPLANVAEQTWYQQGPSIFPFQPGPEPIPFFSSCAQEPNTARPFHDSRYRPLPEAERVVERQLGCLFSLAHVWEAYATQDPAHAAPESFELALDMYSWAADALGPDGTSYLDHGLTVLEQGLASGPPARRMTSRPSARSCLPRSAMPTPWTSIGSFVTPTPTPSTDCRHPG